METGKNLTLIGAILALITVLLSMVLPQFFGWYRVELTSLGITSGVYVTAMGTITQIGSIPFSSNGSGGFEFFGGLLFIIGAIICILGVAKESRVAGIIGGILMLLGPLPMILSLLTGGGNYSYIKEFLGVSTDVDLLWGTFTSTGPPIEIISWGLWIGFFLALASGVLGIIGGAKL